MTEVNKDDVTSVKVVRFDGKEDSQWRSWSAKTRAIGTLNGWVGCLTKDETIGVHDDTTDDEELKAIKNERNAQMYLTLACQDNAFEYIIGKSAACDMW